MLNFDDYKNSLPYPSQTAMVTLVYLEAKRVYAVESTRLEIAFQADALREVGLADHPKRDLIFSKAWEDGHAYGHSGVFNHLQDLAEFVRRLED